MGFVCVDKKCKSFQTAIFTNFNICSPSPSVMPQLVKVKNKMIREMLVCLVLYNKPDLSQCPLHPVTWIQEKCFSCTVGAT